MQDPEHVKTRLPNPARHTGPGPLAALAVVLIAAPGLCAQSPAPVASTPAPQTVPANQPSAAAVIPPTAQAPIAGQTPNASQAPDAVPAPPTPEGAPITPRPIAIVPLDTKIPGAAAEVTGGLEVSNGRAFITSNGTITSGSQTTQVTLPYRGTLRICASTTVKLAADSNVSAGEIPGLLMAMDHGAIEASFATGRDSDTLMTPDFRILIGGPGAADVKVRLGEGGDTCVDNAGVNAPYVLVSSVFDGGAYRVQPGQRVMFQHGSLNQVVDQEKEPCGCPPEPKGGNEFPLAESEGLAPTLHPTPIPAGPLGHAPETSGALVYNGAEREPKPAATTPTPAAPAAIPAVEPAPTPAAQPSPKKKRGFFMSVGRFFKAVFGAD